MKVLQVNCVYKKGSTGKITYDLHKGLLDAGIESVVCYGRGKTVNEPGVYKTCQEWYSKLNNAWSRVTGIMYGGCFFSTNRLISIIKKERPDIVHLQCINGYFVNIYRLVNWLKKHHQKTVLTLHAEFMYTGGCSHSFDCNQWGSSEGCGYYECPRWRAETKSLFRDGTSNMWMKMKKAFECFEHDLIVTSVSPWLMARAKHSSILKGKKHLSILNGLDTCIFHPYNSEDQLRQNLGIKNEKVIFHATPSLSLASDHIKGGHYVVELARALENDNVKIVVAGRYSQEVEYPSNMIMLGMVKDQVMLAQYYSMADITVITSKRETFSMIVAESLCCGTPVVGFKAGGPESISLKEYSMFVEYGDFNEFKKAVEGFLRNNVEVSVEDAYKAFSRNQMLSGYIDAYELLLKE